MCETTIYSPVLPLKAAHDTKVDRRREERVIVQQEFASKSGLRFWEFQTPYIFYYSIMGIFERLLTLLLFKLLNNHGIIFINKKDFEEALRAEMLCGCIRAALAAFNLTGNAGLR